MERLPIAASLLALGLVALGCSGADATVSAEDEAKFKNPAPADLSKVPADAFKPKGAAFVGEPSGATGGSGGSPAQIKP